MVEAQALYLSKQEIDAIFSEHERLAAKSGGAGSGDDAKVSAVPLCQFKHLLIPAKLIVLIALNCKTARIDD